jgi:tRNA(fMet)-specific endonuclease VapC
MQYLIDSNILSDIMLSARGKPAMRLREVCAAQVCTSSIVSAELLFGGYKRGWGALIERITNTLSKIEIVPFRRHRVRDQPR